MTAMREMPQYQCHKRVWALKIKEISQSNPEIVMDGGSWSIAFHDGGFAPIAVSHEWYEKHRPEADGYYVVYEDGYRSYSPAKAFEDGYTLLN